MPYSLKGRNVLVTGGSRGLGASICLKFAAEGCNVAINYVSSKERAISLQEKILKTYPGSKVEIIQGDMSLESDCHNIVATSITALHGLDIIISNAGYTRFSPFADINAPTAEDWDKTFAVNVKAQTHLMKAASSTFVANAEGGVFIMTSSIAGSYAGGSSMPYSVSKAAQLHLMKCLAVSQGPKVRVNAILPGLLLTEWGVMYGPEAIKMMEEKAVLKKTTDLEDTAQMYVDVAKNSSMTGQKITVDSGLTPTGYQ